MTIIHSQTKLNQQGYVELSVEIQAFLLINRNLEKNAITQKIKTHGRLPEIKKPIKPDIPI